MTIIYQPGDIFKSECQALVNPVNCVGVMGKGLAREFKQRFPAHFASYHRACLQGRIQPGVLWLNELGADVSPEFIIALPTKLHWSKPSRLEYITSGVSALADLLVAKRITSVAIPRLGCGLGGLDWDDVHQALLLYLTIPLLEDCRIVLLSH